MQWIERNKKKLWVLEAVALVFIVTITLSLKSRGSVEMEGWQFGLMVLPWFIGFIAAIPLIYLSWSRNQASSAHARIGTKIFFSLFVGVMLIVFIIIYGLFVFS